MNIFFQVSLQNECQRALKLKDAGDPKHYWFFQLIVLISVQRDASPVAGAAHFICVYPTMEHRG